MRSKRQQIAIVEWTDAAMHGTDQFSLKYAKENLGLIDIVSAGIVVHEDRKQITLALDWHHNDDQFRQIASYPKSGIRKITRRYLRKT